MQHKCATTQITKQSHPISSSQRQVHSQEVLLTAQTHVVNNMLWL